MRHHKIVLKVSSKGKWFSYNYERYYTDNLKYNENGLWIIDEYTRGKVLNITENYIEFEVV